MYSPGRSTSHWGFVTIVDSHNITLLSPNHHRVCDQCPERSTVSTSPVNCFLPSPELLSYRAATTTHAYFTATRDTPLTTSIFYTSRPQFSLAPTLLICFSCTRSSRTQDPPFLLNSGTPRTSSVEPTAREGSSIGPSLGRQPASGLPTTCSPPSLPLRASMTSTLTALSVALPPISSPCTSLHVALHHDSALDPTAPIACLTVPALPSSRTSFLRVALRLEQAPTSPFSPPTLSLSHPQACTHYAAAAASTPIAAPRHRSHRVSSRDNACQPGNTHALSFRFCPRTHTLLRRQLAKLDSGRLVLPNGSPLPMTRHAGGVAGHLISQSNATLRVPEHPTTTVPSIRVLPRSTHSKARTELRLSPPLQPTHDSSSPHAAPLPNSAPSSNALRGIVILIELTLRAYSLLATHAPFANFTKCFSTCSSIAPCANRFTR
ncbi:hypothetical protein GGX14DRAFT_575488 [Mycena pura]|uniref:Uncharacterized protein n=1 Tax=Mycena pura TaxID=153505 RepID=A0AAD6UVZ2_9AGAR|nr:hypothetical protein GGX14DRAFT_575488 [Mycena pura]